MKKAIALLFTKLINFSLSGLTAKEGALHFGFL